MFARLCSNQYDISFYSTISSNESIGDVNINDRTSSVNDLVSHEQIDLNVTATHYEQNRINQCLVCSIRQSSVSNVFYSHDINRLIDSSCSIVDSSQQSFSIIEFID
jgi:hypothetical protein